MKTIKFQLEELTCPSCINKIESVLRKQKGVQHAKVLFNSSKVKVAYRDGETDPETLVYFGDELAFDISYTYSHHHKNPSSAHPGLTYEYPFFNGFFSRSKWYSVSQKVVGYENGVPTVFSDQDPSKTIVEVGPQNYVSATDFFEKLTQEYIPFDFFYENYGSDKNPNQASKASLVQQKIAKLMQRTSVKTMKQQIRELKQLTK